MKYDLYLRGYVGGADFDTEMVSKTLAKHHDQPVTVLIDSLGGSLATALSIAAEFKNHGDVSVHFVGMNASAATIASMGAKHISIDQNAMYLVHKCSAEFFQWASLNADQLQEQIELLGQMKADLVKMDNNVAGMYAQKCKKTQEELLDLMKIGGWLNADEALEWGFVDEISENVEDKAPVLTSQIATSMLANNIPLPKNMPIQNEESNAFDKLVQKLSAFFQPKSQNKKIESMIKKLPNLAEALAIQQPDFTLQDGQLTLTAEQVEVLEAHLQNLQSQAEKDKQALATLQSQAEQDKQTIANLEKMLAQKPADETKQVINGNREDVSTETAAFYQTINSARALFEQIP